MYYFMKFNLLSLYDNILGTPNSLPVNYFINNSIIFCVQNCRKTKQGFPYTSEININIKLKPHEF